MHNIIEQTQALSQSDEFSVTAFNDVLKNLLSVYRQRFKEHYKTQADKDLTFAHEAIKELQDRHKDTIVELNNANDSLAERSALLEKIQQLLPKS
ncbi:MAG: hypothetical protein ABGX33_03865 [Cycloclasticus sp.]